MPKINEVAHQLLKHQKPVLFLDTCAILDIIRMPNRLRASELNAVIKIANQTQSNLCSVVAASIVPDEFASLVQDTESELKKFLDELQNSVDNFNLACQSVSLDIETDYSFDQSTLPTTLRKLAESLLNNALILTAQDNLRLQALDRVVFQVAPARKGGQIKDCILIEEYLELAQQLYSAQFTYPLVFISSNTKDFCTNDKQLHPDLVKEFTPVNLQYCKVWNHAAHLLT